MSISPHPVRRHKQGSLLEAPSRSTTIRRLP
jgi:hypothetical protein